MFTDILPLVFTETKPNDVVAFKPFSLVSEVKSIKSLPLYTCNTSLLVLNITSPCKKFNSAISVALNRGVLLGSNWPKFISNILTNLLNVSGVTSSKAMGNLDGSSLATIF